MPCSVGEGMGSQDLHEDRVGAALTLAARAIEAWGAELAVGALEAGFAHAASQPRVFAAGIALGPGGAAVTVWGRGRRVSDACRPQPSPLEDRKSVV